jgi:hypothetical protein
MPIEQALVTGVRSHLVQARAAQIIHVEAAKGCLPHVVPQPVALEPAYRPISQMGPPTRAPEVAPWVYEVPPPASELVRLQAWISPRQDCAWLRAELFLKQLVLARHRVAFEMCGNSTGIRVQYLCHQADEPLLRTVFGGQFERSALSVCPQLELNIDPAAGGDDVVLCDFFPPPPYSHRFTQPLELQRSPLATLISALLTLPKTATGLYQVVFQAVAPDHNWHANVQALLDLEYEVKLRSGQGDPRRYLQQAPSSDLRNMATELELRAHNDKPFFAAALRVAVCGGGAQARQTLGLLAATPALFQHGGRPLEALDDSAYRQVLAPAALVQLLDHGLTYRPGFLANSAELAGLVHLPPPKLTEHLTISPLQLLEPLAPDESLAEGTLLGYCEYAGATRPVCIPLPLRRRHCHVVGRPDMGKSRLLEAMILDDVQRGAGVAVIDPHGDLLERVLDRIPAPAVDRVIYFNPGAKDWVPRWNPLAPLSGVDPGRMADDLVGVIKRVVDGWGDRLEHLLRQTFYGVLNLPDTTLLDVYSLLRKDSAKSARLRRAMLDVIDNEVARDHWQHDFARYNKDDLGPPRNKLSKLLLAGTVSLMLSQPESAFNLRRIMDEGQVLLVDLSDVGQQVQTVLGGLLIALFNLTALQRSAVPSEKRPEFHIYCDEAHRFLTDALAELIAQARKFNVSLTLAHQQLGQFAAAQAAALAGAGSTVVFNVDAGDAHRLRQDMQGRVSVDDLIGLEPRQAIARIGTQVVRFRTRESTPRLDPSPRAAIIRVSHERYYRPVAEVRAELRRRRADQADDAPPLPPGGTDEEPDGFA